MYLIFILDCQYQLVPNIVGNSITALISFDIYIYIYIYTKLYNSPSLFYFCAISFKKVQTHTHTYIYIYIYIFIGLPSSPIPTDTYICICIYIYTCIYIYIYIKRNKGGDTIANYVGNKLILTIPDKIRYVYYAVRFDCTRQSSSAAISKQTKIIRATLEQFYFLNCICNM